MGTTPSIFGSAIQVLEHLEVAEGRLAKESILEANKDNKALMAIIKMAIGTDRYFVRPSMNLVCTSSLSPAESWRAFVDLTRRLKNRELTGNEAKMAVDRFLASCRPILMKWYCRILNHDLRIGVDKNTVQKIWGDVFLLGNSSKCAAWHFNGCALAHRYDPELDKPAVTFPLAVESKLDGERALVICFPRDDTIFVLTRSGRRREHIEAVAEFRQQVISFAQALNVDTPDRPVYLDGEFLAKNWNKTSSIVRRVKNFDSEEFLSSVKYVLWDWAPLDRYLAGSFNMKWTTRKAELLRAAGATRPSMRPVKFSPNVWVMGHTMVYDRDQLVAEYERRVDAGYEGAMLKQPYTAHTFKRSNAMLKVKPEIEVPGRIVGYYEGLDQNSAVKPEVRKRVRTVMKDFGQIKETKQYLYCKTKYVPKLVAKIKHVIQGDNEQRIFLHREDIVGFRHGARLGGFVVELDDGNQIRVGGGYKTKAGNDERSKFWRKRDQYIGMYVDVRVQNTKTADANGRFNKFVRLREDL